MRETNDTPLKAEDWQPILALDELREITLGAKIAVDEEGGTLKDQLERLEARVIVAALERHKGNKTRIADELGLTRVGLRMKLARLGIATEAE